VFDWSVLNTDFRHPSAALTHTLCVLKTICVTFFNMFLVPYSSKRKHLLDIGDWKSPELRL